MKFKAILFDIDGTLLDTTEFILQAFEHTLKKHGYEIPARTEIKKRVGGSLKHTYESFAPGGDFDMLHKSHSTFQKSNPHLAQLFPEILEQ